MRIAIAGFGFVGQAVYAGLKNIYKDEVLIFDPPKGYEEPFETLKEHDVIICCLPTPTENGYQDFSIYECFLEHIQGYEGILLIKSTVLPENILRYGDQFRIVMNPEFLNQNSAIDDFLNQKLIILGGDVKDCYLIKEMYQECFTLNQPEYEIVTAEQAIQFKYLHNIYHAYKILFWNYVQEVTGNSRKIAGLYKKLRKGMDNELSQICADGKPGYGGTCFPKDMAAFDNAYPHPLTDYMIQYNNKLR